MTQLMTIRSPSSYQLRCTTRKKYTYSPVVAAQRIGFCKVEYKIKCFYGFKDNVNMRVSDGRKKGGKFVVKGFSDWSDKETEVANEPESKNGWSGGVVGAAVAGVVLVGGLAFATLSISRRVSGAKKNMETLTTHQEESLTSVDPNENVVDETETKKDVPNDSLEVKENENEIENENVNEKEYEAATENISTQQDTQEELPTDEVQDKPIETPELQKLDVNDDPVDASNINKLDDTHVVEFQLDDSSAGLSHTEILPVINQFSGQQDIDTATDESNKTVSDTPSEQVAAEVSVVAESDVTLEPQFAQEEAIEPIPSINEDFDNKSTTLPFTLESEKNDIVNNNDAETALFDSVDLGKLPSSASIPAPSVLSPALQNRPGKVVVPAVVDQVQGQALAALQVLKVIEGDVQPGDLCTRREYARWLVSASSALSRNTLSKVYPAMYIENVTELAFDDITPEDPDFSSIQGLAEAGLIASKLSRRDMNISNEDDSLLHFCPESPLSRQDLVSWKMSLEKRLLPVADKTILQQLSGFIDIDKINPDAWPALIADLSAGENGIVGLAFGYTRLFQPNKPVTNSQAAIALATGEGSDVVSEELARIEAESMAEKVVAAHSALVDQVQKDVNRYYENDLLVEREKIVTLEKIAEETKQELERLRAEQEDQNLKMMKERAAVDSQMEMLSKLRHETEEELQSILTNKVEISYEKERLNKLRTDAEIENQEISRLQYELEVERKALAMARSWAEDEAKRAREQAKVLEEARDKWESQGIKVVVDKDLRDDAVAESTWVGTQNQSLIEGTKSRAENLVEKLKIMAADVKGKSSQIINKVIEKILFFISQLKEMASKAVNHVGEVKDSAVSKVNDSMQELQQSSAVLSSTVKEGAKRVVGECREGVEKLTHKFKT
ncbi:hypothetical protein CTI12_AA172110 [Artemisia annua]|uniref:SLH domain-containing protein n=1 Tax=Artemisia annua TaxID=35608 RepID=A0A2U1PAV2_ARTAN|nr:hypothetical protein CTI12_AA172110 [Artemisia annua]